MRLRIRYSIAHLSGKVYLFFIFRDFCPFRADIPLDYSLRNPLSEFTFPRFSVKNVTPYLQNTRALWYNTISDFNPRQRARKRRDAALNNRKLSRLLWPNMVVYFVILAAFVAAAVVLRQYLLAAGEAFVSVVAFLIFRVVRSRRKKALAEYTRSSAEKSEAVGAIPFASALIQPESGELLWYNDRFADLADLHDRMVPYQFTDIFPEADLDWLKNGQNEASDPICFGDRRYRAAGGLVTDADDPDQAMAALYLMDETQLLLLRDEYAASRPVVCVILVDNYDELTNNLPDASVSNINAAIDEQIRHWTDRIGGLLRKVERNRYLFLFEARELPTVIDEKFSIIERIRSISNARGLYATISLGIGRDGADFTEGYAFANLAIEMALARGGDQAVIKDRYNFSFYGGRQTETDRRTKVKSRVMASSLSELIAQSSDIFIMGHQNADLDSLGAACGVMCLCRKLGKKAFIVIDREKNASKILLDKLANQAEYRGCLITGQDALLKADPKSLLIVVDTNRPDRVESKPLLECISRICVIDHHRRAADYIDQVVMNLHDPFASSSSELVTELLQYAVDSADLLPVEAQALLSGIVLDTKNFGMRTSGRTFEAAAFLRRLGADTTDVKRIMQNDMDATLQRYDIVQSAQVYRDTIAIAALDHTVSRVIAAQAADELLTIAGITTSFVLYPDPDTEQVVVSARSFGDANVQVIMEDLGGGGNAAIAGAQISDKSVGTVLTELISAIDRFYESA